MIKVCECTLEILLQFVKGVRIIKKFNYVIILRVLYSIINCNLFMLLSLCYCMCCKLGVIKNCLIKIQIKNIKYRDTIRFPPEVTLYKYDFNLLKSLFARSINNSKVAFNQLIRLIINDIDFHL